MNLHRRGFFGALLGAIAAPKLVPEALKQLVAPPQLAIGDTFSLSVRYMSNCNYRAGDFLRSRLDVMYGFPFETDEIVPVTHELLIDGMTQRQSVNGWFSQPVRELPPLPFDSIDDDDEDDEDDDDEYDDFAVDEEDD